MVPVTSSGPSARSRGFAAALGIVDYPSRLAADLIKTSYGRGANESKLYAGLVWGLIAVGIAMLPAGFDQPILLLVISAVVGGFMIGVSVRTFQQQLARLFG